VCLVDLTWSHYTNYLSSRLSFVSKLHRSKVRDISNDSDSDQYYQKHSKKYLISDLRTTESHPRAAFRRPQESDSDSDFAFQKQPKMHPQKAKDTSLYVSPRESSKNEMLNKSNIVPLKTQIQTTSSSDDDVSIKMKRPRPSNYPQKPHFPKRIEWSDSEVPRDSKRHQFVISNRQKFQMLLDEMSSDSSQSES
jgi:hypothetical protein